LRNRAPGERRRLRNSGDVRGASGEEPRSRGNMRG
jgi:hypothetical protein